MANVQYIPEMLDQGPHLDQRALLAALRAVRRGDLSVRLPMNLTGMDGEIAEAFNDLADTNEQFIGELARLRQEVGLEGRIGQRMPQPVVGGAWLRAADAVNGLIGDLARPTVEVARVMEAVVKGDLSGLIPLHTEGQPLRGEFLRVGQAVNTMLGQLVGFASEVSRVAREIGTEGMLGGQARIPGVAGTWKELTDNINQMILNLAQTTRKNTEQSWLKTNVARFSHMLQGHRDLVTVAKLILSELAPLVDAQQGVFYIQVGHGEEGHLELLTTYAFRPNKHMPRVLRFREGLIGQCAADRKRILLDQVPRDYARWGSGLGSALPAGVVILPVVFEGEVKAVLELASHKRFSDVQLSLLDQLTESFGIVFNTIEANMWTEDLLKQSQSMTEELQEKARLLSEQMHQVEYKNREIEQAKAALEEKAELLALSSRYKSEFLANMSHELRTPLNSLFILAKLLSDNPDNNLAPKQVEYAKTIYAAGADLLSLINDILDLAKIESGTVTLDIAPEHLGELKNYVERSFREVAQQKNLAFHVEMDPRLPEMVDTDGKRLQQILKNLLANAFKFTERGSVTLKVAPAEAGWSDNHAELNAARQVVAFQVIDTGIGIAQDKKKLIFEAFQQADGTTSRNYGGTGLGLSISRELTRLLGGELQVDSTPGSGSVFTLYLPLAAERRLSGPSVAASSAPLAAELPGAAAGPGADSSPEDHVRNQKSNHKLADKKVLIIDDDIRNIFALTGALEVQGMNVMGAESGKEGIEILKTRPDIDVVLMDIMMPDLDGFDTTRIIRALDGFARLPIIAVTAKAMKGDREKCLEAGASDYIPKPVNVEQLMSLLRVWLPD